MERITKTTPDTASSHYQVDQQGNTTDRSKVSGYVLMTRSDTLRVAELLSHDSVAELLGHGASPRYLAGIIADWITARHHQVNHNDNKRQTSLYDRDAVERAKLKLAAAPVEAPDTQLSQQLTALDLQRITEDWQYDVVRKEARKAKTTGEHCLKPFLERLSLLQYERWNVSRASSSTQLNCTSGK